MPRLVEIGPVVLERKILKFLQCIFGALHFLPLENGGALHLNNLEYLSPKDALSIVPSLVEINWPSGSGEENFLILSVMLYDLSMAIISNWKMVCVALHLEKHGLSSSKNSLFQVWLKLAYWFWGRRFFS